MNKLDDFVIEPLAIVCHDAGAANLIVSWIKRYKGIMKVCMKGPAQKIWKRHFPDSELLSIERIFVDSNTLLTGTGWGDLEFEARIKAKKKNIKNIAVIDHWTNYSERFIRAGKELLPDIIIVSDKYAYEKACKTFPIKKIFQLPNIYLQVEANLVSSLRSKVKKNHFENLLVIAEPFREKKTNQKTLLEFMAIEYLMLNLNKVNNSIDFVNITIRPHPSEPSEKYVFLIDKYKHLVNEFKISRDKELYEDIAMADIVIGINSFALVVSLTAGVPTMSMLPPGYNNFNLPYNEIIHLRDL